MNPTRGNPIWIADMLDAISAVGRHPLGSYEEFKANELLRYFVVKNLEIIGEASIQLSADLKLAHPEVPWRRVADARHINVHHYYKTNWHLVWEIASQHLPPLQKQLEAIADQLGR